MSRQQGINRTIVELKQRTLGEHQRRRQYQSYHSGIETVANLERAKLLKCINRTIVELKHSTSSPGALYLEYQSYHSGIETVSGRGKTLRVPGINRTIVELKPGVGFFKFQNV